jgi:hypothetical protein
MTSRPYTAAHGQTKAIYLLFVEDYTKAVRQHENDGSIDGPSVPTVKSQIKTLYDIWKTKTATALVASGGDESHTAFDELNDSAFELYEEHVKVKSDKTEEEKKKAAVRESQGISNLSK